MGGRTFNSECGLRLLGLSGVTHTTRGHLFRDVGLRDCWIEHHICDECLALYPKFIKNEREAEKERRAANLVSKKYAEANKKLQKLIEGAHPGLLNSLAARAEKELGWHDEYRFMLTGN